MASDEPVPTGVTWEDLPADILPDRLHAIVRANPPMMARLLRTNPEMAEACQQEDPAVRGDSTASAFSREAVCGCGCVAVAVRVAVLRCVCADTASLDGNRHCGRT